MKKFLTIAAKSLSLLNLIVAVVTGKNVETAVVLFNSAWN